MKKTFNVSVEIGRRVYTQWWDTEVVAETKEEAEKMALAAYWLKVEQTDMTLFDETTEDVEGELLIWDEYGCPNRSDPDCIVEEIAEE